ncbi:MAG TPA: hypothetical protein VMH26_21660 [Burkholderiales bacterium]|nr:hypothetical protein [Burkholderiales bacterium]
MKPTAPGRIGFVSDLHILSRTGLVPPDWRMKRDPLAPMQAYLWDCFVDFRSRCPPLDILVIVGDLVEGETPTMKGTVGGVSDRYADQIEAATEVLGPLVKKSKETILVTGTPFHEDEHVVEDIGSKLRTRKWATNGRRHSGIILDLTFRGQRINCSHHQTRGWMWLGGAASRIAVLSAAAEASAKFNGADVIVRGDLHTSVLQQTLGKWVCFLPAWTMPGAHAIKSMEAVRAHLATDIGAQVMTVTEDGDLAWSGNKFHYPLFKLPIVRA